VINLKGNKKKKISDRLKGKKKVIKTVHAWTKESEWENVVLMWTQEEIKERML